MNEMFHSFLNKLLFQIKIILIHGQYHQTLYQTDMEM
jgi:hypothetical protein